MASQDKDPVTISAPEPTLSSAITSLSPNQEFQRLKTGRMPCARTAFLAGIATAAGTIGVGTVAGRGMLKSLNWGVGAFIFVSIASWETCKRSRAAENLRMKQIIENYDRKKSNAATSSSAHSDQNGPLPSKLLANQQPR